MKCQKCIDEGLRSRVYSDGISSKMMGWSTYYDEDGIYHSHNPNGIEKWFRCSEGHRFHIDGKEQCANCEYGGFGEQIFV
jgi:hypothetical protein